MDIKKIIVDLRKFKDQSGKTWRQVSEESGVSFSLVTKLATKDSPNPTASTIQKIQDYLSQCNGTTA